MPLKKPAPRKHIHTRDIRCHGYQREDGLWDIEATLVDTKTYSFDNDDRGGVSAGEPIHGMHIRLTVDEDLVVREAEAAVTASPFAICGDIAGSYRSLKGLVIGPGWIKSVTQRLGRIQGCTHLTGMLLGPLAVVAYQTVVVPRKDSEQEGEPLMLNTCHALASTSPVVERQWPDHYQGGTGPEGGKGKETRSG
ncbi:MAG: DUF2889 domain-containing protein [Proteobacteria bacterium]|nr:DUF2889 domain-containing protein [Pseudomonadota bacterium]